MVNIKLSTTFCFFLLCSFVTLFSASEASSIPLFSWVKQGTEPDYELMVLEPPVRATSAVIVLHATSGTTSGLLPFIRLLQSNHLSTTRFILPQSPSIFVAAERTKTTSWVAYRKGFNSSLKLSSPSQAASTARKIAELAVNHAGVPAKQTALLGMGTGAAVALAAWAGSPNLAACVALSPPKMKIPFLRFSGSIPFESKALVVHGREDIILKPDQREDGSMYEYSEKDVMFMDYPYAGHLLMEMFPAVSKDVATFLANAFGLLDQP